ncbi:hypothetical protein GPECTOR_9g448 [Gonium pectorale]|uniref:Uncharacterized protein n=1 Tax=Gonium pectorale TaxID=33097 RepID=A0A150GRI5_GONPE|nr:hypothetical protein GPECTOR_9g448 [Gonium pectorale]|eukprot:KXZ52404.1 hypothetical protein GPECTOR_9g448 [Gonium pectorale]
MKACPASVTASAAALLFLLAFLNAPCASADEIQGPLNMNCRQDCVEGQQCLELSRDVAGNVANAACSYAASRCQPQIAAALSVSRQQCYRAAKNVCINYGREYAQNGGGSCSGYVNGVGTCSTQQFRRYFNDKLNDLCESVGRGIAISLP